MIIIAIAVLLALVVFVVSQFVYLWLGGTAVPVPDIPRQPQVYGEGDPLTYVVMGDSVTVGQGGDYDRGVAQMTARHLAKGNKVTMLNTGESGARAHDVLTKQLPQIITKKPDVVLIVVGSNDVTHVTPIAKLKRSLQTTVDSLVAANCNVKIVMTGAGEMGAAKRIPQPTRWLAGQRTKAVNKVFAEIISQNQLTKAQIAEKTGDTFKDNPNLFAPDNFHPNNAGYDTWTAVINDTLDEAIATQPSHCK